MDDFLFRGDLADLDPDVAALVALEEIRQAKRLILIPSESSVPASVRQAVGSAFHNIYAEGYPTAEWRDFELEDILAVDVRLAEYRRYSDARYYKGTEFADIVESLARRRAAELFATERVGADRLWVNVQPLSGAPANNAVYSALLQPGDTIMGLDLLHGGHLTHGSPVNRSGILYNIVSYSVDPDTELLNYDTIRQQALEARPKIIVAGFTSYPYAPDWAKFRAIADEVGALLLADVSHVSGLIVAGVFPTPVGIADVISFTTHKTMAGPRGAVLMTTDPKLGKQLDRAVFPGEQGGPHVNAIAGMAVAFKLAATEQFHALQRQTVRNAQQLATSLAARGIRIPHGGTDTHLLVADCKSVTAEDGTPLSGDLAARILDLAGIVCNRNTIPGDTSAFRATGLRFGTPWITQRGFREPDVERLANIIADVLLACRPYSYLGSGGKETLRAKLDYDTLAAARREVDHLATVAGLDYDLPDLARYPKEAEAAAEHFRVPPADSALPQDGWRTLDIYGPQAREFLHFALTSDVLSLETGEYQPTWALWPDGTPITYGVVHRLHTGTYLLHVPRQAAQLAMWLQALSDGFVIFDPTDIYGRMPGPVSVGLSADAPDLNAYALDFDEDWADDDTGYQPAKAYFVGGYGPNYTGPRPEPLPSFGWTEPEDPPLKTTTLHSLHRELGAKMVPFAGYDMPVWYTSVGAEHNATRTGAGLFDVSHMGVFEFSGSGAEAFLNALTANDVSVLEVGSAHYSYLLGVDGIPIDDIFIYRLAPDYFIMVVNASNNDKDWAWIQGLKEGEYQADADYPGTRLPGRRDFTLRDLRDPALGDERRVDIALQGPASRDILLSLHGSPEDKARVKALPWAGVTRANLGGYDLIVARTGYTGERVAYELFIDPDQAPALFKDLVESGATPIGLAARDSLRTEAGLPLYGHELAGDLNLNPADAGFGSFVKLWKPFFIGKDAFIAHERERDAVVTRFRLDSKGVRQPHPGDPIVDARGRVIGTVTSCSIDQEGYSLGQAYLKLSHAEEGTPVLVYSAADKSKLDKPLGALRIGDRTVVPNAATVLSRFPKRKK
ncbi:MAG: glycine cleavage system aminomethyltransferase GcvT [Chloroflexi bacterium]|nr:glycine cleavage system aminomethyltransferase GcvT [Chloroflexota bacterium]